MIKNILLFYTFLVSLPATGQPLFTYLSDDAAGLSAAEYEKLAQLRANPVNGPITMVRVGNLPDLVKGNLLEVNLPDGSVMKASAYNVINKSFSPEAADYVWEGAFTDGEFSDGRIHLIRQGRRIFGTIYPFNSGEAYELITFPSGKNALLQYNRAVCAARGCGMGQGEDGATSGTGEKPTACPKKVRVKVLYTSRAYNAVSDIYATAMQGVQLLNGAVYNSVGHLNDLEFELAGIESVAFDETAQQNSSLSCAYSLALTPAAQYQRGNADLVICLTDANFTDNTIGSAAGIGPKNASAFAVVEADLANNYYSFAHEAGHLMGGRHQQSWVSSTVGAKPIDYDDTPGEAHGYKFIRKQFVIPNRMYSDIMHAGPPNATGRQHYFSTPNRKIWDKALGIAGSNDVTNTLLANACTVAEFRGETAPKMDVKIKGPGWSKTGHSITFTYQVEDGYPPYTVNWYTSPDGFNWTLASTGAGAFTTVMPSGKLFVGIGVWDFFQGASDGKTVNNLLAPDNGYTQPAAGAPMRQALPHGHNAAGEAAIYPNPASGQFHISLNLAEEAENESVEFTLTDLAGRTLIRKALPHVSADIRFSTSGLANGVYFLRLEGRGIHKTEKLTIKKTN